MNQVHQESFPIYKATALHLPLHHQQILQTMDTNNQDMFIRLTNSLLVLIVSNLPFKGSARTSILSKQWLNIWRESTNLELNESSFVKLEENQEIQRIQRITFFDFVRHFIVSYPQKAIQKFAVACSKPKRFLSDMQNFVTFAISRNVKELEIDFSDPTWREDNLDNHPAVAELPLQAYHHVGLESLKSLLVNCPLLESLSLRNCWNVIEHFEISLPNLKLRNLVLDKCNFIHDMFWIDGPKLKFLKYSGKIGYFHLLDQRDMTEADLDFGMKLEFEEVGALLYDFLQELYSVRVLTVCSVFLQVLAALLSLSKDQYISMLSLMLR
ncbi:putative F-box protein At3g29830 [Hevea brasiliensis]|uniref:putative F-box protein At3g29830 n=1 Tax=Hevea brasiliensis TaxID=3981 RepID=UPI0025F399A3|nr:putative F-box protein At3g29830 [Hevea brasiliensis]